MRKLWEKKYKLYQFFKHSNKTVFDNIIDNLKVQESKLADLEPLYNDVPSGVNLRNFNSQAAIFQSTLNMEELYCKQEACCKWTLEGDRNTKLKDLN